MMESECFVPATDAPPTTAQSIMIKMRLPHSRRWKRTLISISVWVFIGCFFGHGTDRRVRCDVMQRDCDATCNLFRPPYGEVCRKTRQVGKARQLKVALPAHLVCAVRQIQRHYEKRVLTPTFSLVTARSLSPSEAAPTVLPGDC
jgi:hypothetical protein